MKELTYTRYCVIVFTSYSDVKRNTELNRMLQLTKDVIEGNHIYSIESMKMLKLTKPLTFFKNF